MTILSQSPVAEVEALAEAVLPRLGAVDVLANRTGIVVLPYADSAKGVTFHLGEVLMAEARVRATLPSGAVAEGYGACMGRNTRFALALALLDVAWRYGMDKPVLEAFVARQASELERKDQELLRNVEDTRVQMETF